MRLNTFLIAVVSVLLNAAAQLAIKSGTNSLRGMDLKDGVMALILKIVFNPGVISGLLFYVISVAVWIYVLSKVEVGVAYPLLSIGYVINLFLAAWLFGELITINKIFGVCLIISGVYIITRVEQVL
jgi:multidrug transporter EmrE-like cation transporter